MARILVVDDSRHLRGFMRLSLQQAGHEAEEVEPASLYDVLSTLHAYQPDLLVTDYEMPACNGETLVRALREDPALHRLPILLVTSHKGHRLQERFEHQWGARVLFKPFQAEGLLHEVREALVPSLPPQNPLAHRRVAVVDDSRLMRVQVVRTLAGLGFEAASVDPSSLFEVLKTLRALGPDVLITDFSMPECPGETLIRAVRGDPVLKRTPILLLTAHPDPETVARLAERWSVHWMAKPATPEGLLDALGRLPPRIERPSEERPQEGP